MGDTYTGAGEVQAAFSVADRDGDVGGEVTLTISVEPAAEAGDETPMRTEPPTAVDGTGTTAMPGTGAPGLVLGAGAAAVLLTVGTLPAMLRRRLHS